MAVVPAGFIVGWPSAGAIPTGWERATELDDKHPKGAAAGADPGISVGPGAETHTHQSSGHTHTVSSHTHAGGTSGTEPASNVATAGASTTISEDVHTHTFSTSGAQTATLSSVNATVDSTAHEQPYNTVRWIRSLGTASGIPDGAWALWDDATLPSGWSAPAAAEDAYLKGASTGANGGGTGGSASGHTHSGVAHTHEFASHTHTGGTTSGPSATDPSTAPSANNVNAAPNNHIHNYAFAATPAGVSGSTASGVTGSQTTEPPFVKLGVVQNDNGAVDLPVGIIGAWLGLRSAIPLSLAECDGSGTSQDTRGLYIKGATTDCCGDFADIGDTGGSLFHDHTDPSTHTHDAAHTHAVTITGTGSSLSVLAGSNIGANVAHQHAAAVSGSGGGTSGTGTQTVSQSTNEPPNTTVIWVKYTGSIDVTITSPTEGEVITAPGITVTWTLSAGTQTNKRVKIFASDQSTLIHDSGTVVDATQSYTVPSTAGLRTGRTYYLQVSVTNNSSLPGASTLLSFITAWTPPATIGALTLTPIGGV